MKCHRSIGTTSRGALVVLAFDDFVAASCHAKCHREGDGDTEQQGAGETEGVESDRDRPNTMGHAPEMLFFLPRHWRGTAASCREEGGLALVHDNRDGRPHNALDRGLLLKVVEPTQSPYASCGAQHFIGLLTECGGISVLRCAMCLISLRQGQGRGPGDGPRHDGSGGCYVAVRGGMLWDCLGTMIPSGELGESGTSLVGPVDRAVAHKGVAGMRKGGAQV